MEGSNKTPYEPNNKSDTTRHLRAMEGSSNKTPYESGNNELQRTLQVICLSEKTKGALKQQAYPLFVVLLDGVDEASSLASLLKVREVSFTNLAIMW
jgi:hypothetical protein